MRFMLSEKSLPKAHVVGRTSLEYQDPRHLVVTRDEVWRENRRCV